MSSAASALVLAAAGQPQYLAHHALVFAIPVLIPTFVVVLLVALVVVRDRRRGDDDEPVDQAVPGAPDARDDPAP